MKRAAAAKRKVAARPKPRAQYAALPFRRAPELEILLVTSRETARWVIPKGWPMRGKTRREAAIVEAIEEAGVEGRLIKKALGQYQYLKVLRSGDSQRCKVTVFALEVTLQRAAWREQDQRSSQWFASDAAAAAVREPGLARMIRKFAVAMSTAPEVAADPETP